VLVVNSLVQGGAQRYAVDFADQLAALGHQVELITFYPSETDFFQIPENINVTRFTKPFEVHRKVTKHKSFFSNSRYPRAYARLRDLRDFRKFIKLTNPELVIAIERYVGVLVGLSLPRKCHIVISDRVHPGYHTMTRLVGKLDKCLVRFVYRRRNVFLHAQGEAISSHIRAEFGKPVVTIPNFVNPEIGELEPETRESQSKYGHRIVLAVGRFCSQKGFDLLVRAWSEIDLSIRREWQLHIYGDGDRSEIETLVNETRCSDSIQLFGATKSISELYKMASVFILPSRYEGFPNVLAEAMASGLPCIATDSPSAVRDLTLNGELALLVNLNSKDISIALSEFMKDEKLRNYYASAALKTKEVFSYPNIMPLWIDFLRFVWDNDKESKKCPACSSVLLSKNIKELKTETQIVSDLKKDWGIDFKGEVNPNTKIIARYECVKCGLQSFNSPQGDSDFYMACHNSVTYERSTSWDYQRVVNQLCLIGDSILNDNKFLDIGSGKSKFLDLLPNPKMNLDIVELDSEVRKQQESEVRNSFTNILDVSCRYDVIMMSHYLEHVENPVEVLSRIEQLCNSNATLVITVPDAEFNEELDSPLGWPPHHALRFSKRSLINLVENFGFQFLKIETESGIEGASFDFSVHFRFGRN